MRHISVERQQWLPSEGREIFLLCRTCSTQFLHTERLAWYRWRTLPGRPQSHILNKNSLKVVCKDNKLSRTPFKTFEPHYIILTLSGREVFSGCPGDGHRSFTATQIDAAATSWALHSTTANSGKTTSIMKLLR